MKATFEAGGGESVWGEYDGEGVWERSVVDSDVLEGTRDSLGGWTGGVEGIYQVQGSACSPGADLPQITHTFQRLVLEVYAVTPSLVGRLQNR